MKLVDKKWINRRAFKEMVPPARIELALPCGNWILNPARLPVPPQGHANHHRQDGKGVNGSCGFSLSLYIKRILIPCLPGGKV